MNNSQNLKIIIADDHHLICAGLELLIKNIFPNSFIAIANNGKQVIELLKKQVFDIVLMDIRMPEMNGITATGIISKKYKNVKVIALSVFDDKSNILSMLEMGAKGFLTKETERDDLFIAINSVLNGNEYFSSNVSEVLAEEVRKKTNLRDEKIYPNSIIDEHIRKIIFLTCYELNAHEIGDAICLSARTVETYKILAAEKVNCKGLSGLVRFGIESDLYKDPELLVKFANHIKKKKKNI